MIGLCRECKTFKELTRFDEEIQQGTCADCQALLPVDSRLLGVAYLLESIPFTVGDVVEARTGGEDGVFDGVGRVEEVYIDDLEHGATVVHPTFKVAIEQPAHENAPPFATYTENCLTKVSK